MKRTIVCAGLKVAVAASMVFCGTAAVRAASLQARAARHSSAAAVAEWNNARQISPAELAKRVTGPKSARPIVLQVGFKILYDGAHIPGAIYAGPASEPGGIERLKAIAEKLPRNREIVIYCGCCPWEKCPNVRPAYEELRKMGFTRVVALLIPQDFAHDWVAKGYPVVRSR